MESTTQKEPTGKFTQFYSAVHCIRLMDPDHCRQGCCAVCRANDAGMSAYDASKFGEAFQNFSEAIRLCPGNCIYHANRASAALHLGLADVALQDAKYVPWLQHSKFEEQTWNYRCEDDQSLYTIIMNACDQ